MQLSTTQKYATHTGEFSITVGDFQGSLEALLVMVQKRKMNINEISLAHIADEYVAYVRSLPKMSQLESVHFMVIAATLLLIKSRALLPNLVLTQEEEEDVVALQRRLRHYKIYKEAYTALQDYVAECAPLYAPKRIRVQRRVSFSPADNLTQEALVQAAHDVVSQLPSVEKKPSAEIAETIDIDKVIASVRERIRSTTQQSFNALLQGVASHPHHRLVHFLAVLELVKNGELHAQQDRHYGDILLQA